VLPTAADQIEGTESQWRADCFRKWRVRVFPLRETPQVAVVPEGIMSNTEQNKTDRPAGTVDEDANPPLTDETKTDVDPNAKTVPPRGADPTKSEVHSEQGSKPPQDARLIGPAGT
jgi:hypothetical protein